jgi:hypothetical protein
MAPLFGRLSSTDRGHWPAFVLGGALYVCAAFVFGSIPAVGRYRMTPFRPVEVLRVALRDRALRRIVTVVVIYGWMGAGLRTLLVALYRRNGFTEFDVGLVAAATTVGMVLSALVVTPFLRFDGGLRNFRLCYTSAALAASLYLLAALLPVTGSSIYLIAAANLVFGVAVTGFTIAAQTSALNLAHPDEVSLYVNTFKFFQGARGLIFPPIVAWATARFGLPAALAVAVLVSVGCAISAWLRGAEVPRVSV